MQQVIIWVARILSFFIFVFFGYLFFTDLSGSSLPHNWMTFLSMGLILLGLIGAWKWELIGGIVAMIGYFSLVYNMPDIIKAWPYAISLLSSLLFIINCIAKPGKESCRPITKRYL